ncbi:glycosyl transferase [Lysobacteraceae bacterium NML93-0399]|nr:glycosyl transferase [Xanthomonadaceae bacterium NML93-0399]
MPTDPERTPRPVRVLHFVTGGFSGGATQVAIALVNAARAGADVEPLLVLRRKRRTDPTRISELEHAGVPLQVVPGWSHLATIAALVRICREFRPDVLVAHGFSEHLWGRYAGLLAGVPHLVHVEHNTRERYTGWRRAQTRWLARRTSRIVGCSEGVRQVLLSMGMPPTRTVSIANGIRTAPFVGAADVPPGERTPGIVMVSRLSKQKDHATLLRALAVLGTRGLRPALMLAGAGKARHRQGLERLVSELRLEGQVQFLGLCRNVPELLRSHRVAVLSTHYEGMPLALIEGMAAGCAVVGSAVPGVQEVIDDGVDGLLVRAADPDALADALEWLLRDEVLCNRLGRAAHERALHEFSRERMSANYDAMCIGLAAQPAFRGD